MSITASATIPIQRISYAEKMKDDCAWGKECVEAYVRLASFGSTSYKLYLKKLYDYYNGHIDEADYTLVTQPYGIHRENFPAEIRNFNIIKPKVDLLRGEYAKRPDTFTVVVKNEDVVSVKLSELNEVLNKTLEQIFINKLNAAGVETGVPSQEVKTPPEVAREFEINYRDKRAITGQRAISYIKSFNHMEEWLDIAFLDWMTTGEVYTYRYINQNEPEYEVVNPLDIDYDKDPDLLFVEDGDWVTRRKYMHASSVIDFFYDVLTAEEVKELERSMHHIDGQFFLPFAYLQDRAQMFRNYGRLIEVIHVCWKSRKKIGILSYLDEMGQPQQIEVTEDYKPNKEAGETIEWLWVNEVWQGYKIDGKYYKRMEPLVIQRGSMDNYSSCKLPYNGRTLSNRNSRNISLVSLGVPYQVTYNIVKYRLELVVAKMKDTIGLIDINVIPKGWDIDKFMYYLDATGLGFVDYNKEGVKLNPQHQTAINLASQTISLYIELLDFIRTEWDDLCGITKQRQGAISSSETVGGVERAVVQSSLTTEIYFRLFDQLKQRDYEALLDYSKIAWINGKKTSFVLGDTAKTLYLDIDGLTHSETEYGIVVSNSAKEVDKFQKMEALAQAFTQNGTPASTIAELFDSENFAEIKNKLKEAEAINSQAQQAMEEAKNAKITEQIQANMQIEDNRLKFEADQREKDREIKVRVAEINAMGFAEDKDTNDNNVPDVLELEKLRTQERMQNTKLNIEQKMQDKEIAAKERIEDKKLKASKNKASKK